MCWLRRPLAPTAVLLALCVSLSTLHASEPSVSAGAKINVHFNESCFDVMHEMRVRSLRVPGVSWNDPSDNGHYIFSHKEVVSGHVELTFVKRRKYMNETVHVSLRGDMTDLANQCDITAKTIGWVSFAQTILEILTHTCFCYFSSYFLVLSRLYLFCN